MKWILRNYNLLASSRAIVNFPPLYLYDSFLPGIFFRFLNNNPFPSVPQMRNELFVMIRESGYLHEQATKPDTVGASLVTSPAGLAAWILEKFSSATNLDNLDREDGGLHKIFTMDELLGDVTLYWVTGTGGSAARFYAENFRKSSNALKLDGALVTVPTGIAVFPNELGQKPREEEEEEVGARSRAVGHFFHHFLCILDFK